MKKLCFIMFILFFSNSLFSQQKEVSFTLDDRDRIIRTEEKVESLRKEMNAKFEGIEHRFNAQDMKFESIESRFELIESRFDLIYWALAIIISLIIFLLGYNIWDRRTLLHPIKKKTDDNQDKINKWEKIAKQQAKEDPKFAEKLRLAGLL